MNNTNKTKLEQSKYGIEVSNFEVIKAYWKGAKTFLPSIVIIVFGIVMARIAEVAVPIYYKKFFDLLSAGGDPFLLGPSLTKIVVFIFTLNMIVWFGYRATSFFITYFQSSLMAKLRQQAFDYMIDHSYSFYANSFTGSLVQRVNRFARASEVLSDRIIFSVIPLIIQISGSIIVLWFNNHFITYVLMVAVFVFLIFNFYFAKWKMKYDTKRASMDSFATGVLSDSIANQNTIQLFTGSKYESGYYKEVTNDQAKITRTVWDLNNVLELVLSFVIFLIEFLLFYYAIKYWQVGTISVGTFVLIQVYLFGIGSRLWDFSRVIRDINESFTDAREMVEILKLPHGIKDVKNAKSLNVTEGEINFENVCFNFSDSRPVLKDINLVIKPGEKIALIGPSGAGKSTFVKLLFRMYDIVSGAIRIDGQDIGKVTQESLRHNLSLVPQDPILFHRTLLENIRYGRRDATDEEVYEAGRLAHCDEFARGLKDGYGTYVGERGVKLSGGERQRVAIARAILKNAPILVLDEATSSLDSHSESLIQDALDKLMKGKTTIVIAHRLSTIRKMDRIIVVEKGNIVEEGSHDELLKNNSSLYKKLWDLQAGGFVEGE